MKIIKRWIQLDPNNSDSLTSQNIPYILNNTTTIYDKLQQIENDYVKKAGDTMTGDLTMNQSNIIFPNLGKGIQVTNAWITSSTTNNRGVKFHYSSNAIEFMLNNDSYTDIKPSAGLIRFQSDLHLYDYNSAKYYGFQYSGNKLQSNLLQINNGPVLIGSTQRSSSSNNILELSGVTSSAFLSVQDGNGRIQLKWNATRGTSETFLVGSENAAIWKFDPDAPGTDLFKIKFSDGSSANAGDSITWIDIFSVGTGHITYKGYKIWHEGNDGSNSGLDADKTDGYHIWVGTQTDYNNISTKDPNTLYFITS